MTIVPRMLKDEASVKLSSLTCKPNKTLLIYAAVSFGVSLLAALMNLFLNGQVAQTGGLDGMEIKALWETLATVSELAMVFLTPVWSLGLIAVVLRFARGQNAQPKELTTGFSCFFRAIGLRLLTAFLYIVIAFFAVFITTFLLNLLGDQTRLAAALDPFVKLLEENPDAMQDASFLSTLPWGEILASLWLPLAVSCLLLVAAIVYLSYRLRLAPYFFMDDPDAGPVRAIRKSFRMMKGNILTMLKVDLSFWWYYLITIGLSVVSASALIPFLLGAAPVGELATIGFQFAASIGYCVLYGVKGAYVETSYALAYEALKVKTL